jgi:hypothetical protein
MKIQILEINTWLQPLPPPNFAAPSPIKPLPILKLYFSEITLDGILA